MKQVRDLVSGRIDFHIHPGPDPFARVLDSYEISWLAERYGMKAVVFKTSHYQGGCTAEMIDKMFPTLKVVGAVCIENAIGGFNPRAVDIALQCGAKVVWMPFLDARHNTEIWSPDNKDLSPGDYIMMRDLNKSRPDQSGKKINITENGEIVSGVREIFRLVAQYNVAVCSGHMNAADREVFVKTAREEGVKKIVLTHVNALQAYAGLEELKRWRDEPDVFAEFVFNPIIPYFSNQDPQKVCDMIRTIGVEKVVLGTDLGISQAFKGLAWPSPLEGMAAFVGLLEQNGFSDKEIDIMSIENASYLLGLS